MAAPNVRLQIQEFLEKHQVVVISSPTGTGKTTQVPQECLWNDHLRDDGQMRPTAITQPRQFATRDTARRCARELDVPVKEPNRQTREVEGVGYRYRDANTITDNAMLHFYTDGTMEKLASGNPDFFDQYARVIVDEAHERTTQTDVLLNKLKKYMRTKKDKQLQVVIMSATISASVFHDYFVDFHPGVLELTRPMGFPVQKGWTEAQKDFAPNIVAIETYIVRVIRDLVVKGKPGEQDTLIFMPGEAEIMNLAKRLADEQKPQDRGEPPLPPLRVFKFYSAMDNALKDEAKNSHLDLDGRPRIIIATNIAETSVTFERLSVVIDSGLQKVSRWDPFRHCQEMSLELETRAAADQRAGRVGRTAPGTVVYCFPEDVYKELRPHLPAAIETSRLATLWLSLIAEDEGQDPEHSIDWLTKPDHAACLEAEDTLLNLRCINSNRWLTNLGMTVNRLGCEIECSVMIVRALDLVLADRARPSSLFYWIGLAAVFVLDNPARYWVQAAKDFYGSGTTKKRSQDSRHQSKVDPKDALARARSEHSKIGDFRFIMIALEHDFAGPVDIRDRDDIKGPALDIRREMIRIVDVLTRMELPHMDKVELRRAVFVLNDRQMRPPIPFDHPAGKLDEEADPMLYAFYQNVAIYTGEDTNYRDFKTKDVLTLNKDTLINKKAVEQKMTGRLNYPKLVLYHSKRKGVKSLSEMDILCACEINGYDLDAINAEYFRDVDGSEPASGAASGPAFGGYWAALRNKNAQAAADEAEAPLPPVPAYELHPDTHRENW